MKTKKCLQLILKLMLLAALLLFCFASAIASKAQTPNTLVDFDGANGDKPEYMSLVQGIDGNLYGTTAGGGAYSQRTIFSITPSGTLNVLHSFCAVVNNGYCADVPTGAKTGKIAITTLGGTAVSSGTFTVAE